MNMPLTDGIWLIQVQSSSGTAQWFDKETLFTAAGTTAAVIAVTSVLHRLWANLPAKWFGLCLSLLLALLAISVRQQGWTAINVLIALINGLMTYAAAVGINAVSTAAPGPAAPAAPGRSYRWWL
jgi:hypothetical protein